MIATDQNLVEHDDPTQQILECNCHVSSCDSRDTIYHDVDVLTGLR
jgi:hypothetical protein